MYWLALASAFPAAGENPKFSSGLIHSGRVEIELDISGATKLSLLSATPRIEWSSMVLTTAKGDKVPAKNLEIESQRKPVFDLKNRGFIKFSAVAKVEKDKSGSTQIVIAHDAPESKIRPDPKELSKRTGNIARGRNLFFGGGTCASCHVIDGRGGRVGPDLSALGKSAELFQILESIIAPDTVLAPGFETMLIESKDDTPHLGFVVRAEKKMVVLRDSAGQSHEIKSESIRSQKPQTFSMMPSFGEILSEQQLVDLATFLKAQRG